MQGLLPGAEGGETETVHRGGELVQECDAFVECEAGEEVVDALVQGSGGVAEERRRAFGHVLRSLEEEKQEEDLEAELEVVREQISRDSKRFDVPSPRPRRQGVHASSHRPAEDPVNVPLSNGRREN
ncbi:MULTISPECIES: hypothetical protein [unclassified Streptomyces]|uniref:hypothetical protein n=1 Tax=unclassified Streptomyces TaxID=2593676 RepID=UPI00224DD3E8|nr:MULTISPECIES: hypothetical protein [unclassified Streptomyces]MCX5328179.1 hypothetical protein [Streptomyces sp. NBC_00140]MCX5357587.1 hypothetical protein [Streptomyces sp. NBC_00124]